MVKATDLVKHFPITSGVIRREVGRVHAVDGVSFAIDEGKTLGLVGESGCGKTTLGRALLRLTQATSGRVEVDGQDVYALNKKDLRAMRCAMQIVFQDPYSSLNPRLTVGELVGQALKVHGIAKTPHEVTERVLEMLCKCGLSADHIACYPHEFSGGQRQRICIARALALDPRFVVCDEPVSALDASIQAQIVNLLRDLQREMNLTYLFISHDLSVVRYISDDIAVMYLGKLVELAGKDELFENALHPYTQALLSALPVMDPAHRRGRILLTGDMPSASNPPSGCRFHTRCPRAAKVCIEVEPAFQAVSKGHYVACHLYDGHVQS